MKINMFIGKNALSLIYLNRFFFIERNREKEREFVKMIVPFKYTRNTYAFTVIVQKIKLDGCSTTHSAQCGNEEN